VNTVHDQTILNKPKRDIWIPGIIFQDSKWKFILLATVNPVFIGDGSDLDVWDLNVLTYHDKYNTPTVKIQK